ncbi:MAG: tRNA 2-thiouridine(34) synthase MnmA [Weeping tea tree witches'-broom phytoplasma]|uniref:tRNA 2-thiouridine(34) synthase MnmA n=1 Tax=Candidatus Phytoplasma melaleucae TaxID=2982630 RepID=UPI002939F4C0|nr:tRNA 2-thiouridine(34) synthase MnmA [Weeping tea tree witches'-broom phytoplasma]
MKKKVIIGLSGGVDSSVAALILQKHNYEVEGIFMRNWDSSLNYDIQGNPYINNNICPQAQDFQDALKIAQQLNIKCHKVDFSHEYWTQVFTSFLKFLSKNLTPNPDVLCNNHIKFLTFIKYAEQFQPDYIAMGHYAKVTLKNKRNILTKALDVSKDQTYFLSQLQHKQLNKIIFPLGNLTKNQVRKIAVQESLVTAHKKDSTGICFIGERKFSSFLQNYLPIKKGVIKNINNDEVLKQHQGVIYYTIGQRKGLNLGDINNNSLPWFVVGKNLKTNTLYVDQNHNSPYLYSDSALVINVVWRSYKNFNNCGRMKLKAKFRYRQPDQDVEIDWINKKVLKVYYPKTIKSVTPGQVCAFYYNEFCLGAGMIKEVYYQNQKRLYT